MSLVTNKAYTELASGLCVQGPDGTWTDAVPVIAPDNVLGEHPPPAPVIGFILPMTPTPPGSNPFRFSGWKHI